MGLGTNTTLDKHATHFVEAEVCGILANHLLAMGIPCATTGQKEPIDTTWLCVSTHPLQLHVHMTHSERNCVELDYLAFSLTIIA